MTIVLHFPLYVPLGLTPLYPNVHTCKHIYTTRLRDEYKTYSRREMIDKMPLSVVQHCNINGENHRFCELVWYETIYD